MRRNTTFVAIKDKRYLRVCHCNQANEALKKPHMWPSITDCTKEMQFIRLRCGGFGCSVIWVQLSVILQQRMLTMPHSATELGGGCYHQLDERFTANQTMLKYAESSSTLATLPVIPSPPCLFLFLMLYMSDHALQGQALQFPLHFSCVCGNAGPTPAEHLCTATM